MFTRFTKSLIGSAFVAFVSVTVPSGVALADNCRVKNRVSPDMRIADCNLWIGSPAFPYDGHKAATYLGRALGYLQKNQFDLAIADYDTVIKASPRLVEAYLGRGVADVFLGDFWEAGSDFQEALRLAPDDPAVKLLRNTAIATAAGKLHRTVLLELFVQTVTPD